MTGSKHPEFLDLSRTEAVALLARNHIGRLAYTFHDRVDIEPVSYVFSADWVYGRTAPGAKLTTLQHHPWVAFEVDEVQDRLNWQSVVVHGAIYLLQPDGAESAAYATALAALRSIDAHALTDGDATPFRTVVVGFHASEITGKAARTHR
jgi:nitroimidazol reductase NimA-like FMN-containing flavoprotein (pyridoxamine 5'-phosphate oxidase superfamily)